MSQEPLRISTDNGVYLLLSHASLAHHRDHIFQYVSVAPPAVTHSPSLGTDVVLHDNLVAVSLHDTPTDFVDALCVIRQVHKVVSHPVGGEMGYPSTQVP